MKNRILILLVLPLILLFVLQLPLSKVLSILTPERPFFVRSDQLKQRPFDRTLYGDGGGNYQRPEKKPEPLQSVWEAPISLPTISYQINKVIGQPNEKETMVNKIVPNRGFHLGGVHVDSAGRIYVFDSGNNRILGFSSFQNQADQTPDIVIGQPQTSEKGTANGDNTQYTQPRADTVAFQGYPNIISTMESPRSTQMTTDSENNFYAVDAENNRVLKFNSPFTTDTIADEVWGQPDMTSRTPYCGQSGLNPTNQNFCIGTQGIAGVEFQGYPYSTGVTIDPAGNLWVADTLNNRVLRFASQSDIISKTADLVLGQTDFSSRNFPGAYTKTLSQMQKPIALRIKPSTGELYVLEGEWAGQARILVFSPPFSTGMAADREIGRAQFQDSAPQDTTNWEYLYGKWVHVTTGLYWARGFNFDPSEISDVYVLDGGNMRAVLLGMNGQIVDILGQPNGETRGCMGWPGQGFKQKDGTIAHLCQADGGIGIDVNGKLYISTTGNVDSRDVARFSTPWQKDANGYVISDGWLLHQGRNQYSGQTLMNGYGLSVSKDPAKQLYISDGQRLLVFNDPTNLSTYASANYVIGQDFFDQNHNNNGGIFHAVIINGQTTGAGKLFITSDHRIFVFNTPITGSGKNYPAFRILSAYENYETNVTWNDDNTFVRFEPSGLAYDEINNALFVSDIENQRVLRIRDPLGVAKIDLVIGQPNKTASSPNAGNSTPVRNGLWNPTYLKLDNFGNLYIVDASYELNGNRRVLRYDASTLVPDPTNIFPMRNASAVLSKSSFTSNNLEIDQPGSPSSIGFDEYNRMILTADGYGNVQYERVYVYNTPHQGEIIYPDAVVNIPIAQGASVGFENGQFIIQDHTWDRVIFTTLGLPVSPTMTPTLIPPTNTPIPPTPTNTPAPPTPTNTPIPPTPTNTPPTPTNTPVPPSSTPSPLPNLLLNSSFESDADSDNRPDNWTSSSRFTRSNASVHVGSYSGRHYSTSNDSYNIDQTVSNILANTNYTFSGWTNIPSTSDSFTYKIQLKWRNSGGSVVRTDTVKSYTTTTGGWNLASATKTSPSNAKSVSIRMNVSSLKATIYADSFNLKKY